MTPQKPNDLPFPDNFGICWRCSNFVLKSLLYNFDTFSLFQTPSGHDADGDGNTRAELLHTTCGTPNYVAPEVLGKDGYDGKKADVWSIGVILYVLLAGYLPFDENTMAALFQKIKNADFEYPDWFSAEAKDLLSKILIPDPANRAKLSDLKNHPWMQHGDSGPTPSAGNNSAAVAGAPVVSNTKPAAQPAPVVAAAKKAPAQPHNKDAAVTALTASTKEEAPVVAPIPTPPVATTNGHSTTTSAAEPVKVSPPAPPAASTQKPLEVQKPADSRASEHDDDAPGGFFCCGAKPRKQTNDSKQYDRV
eukprot:gene29848-36967_t